MPTTTNMGLVLPDDHGSTDVWGSLLNAVFGINGGGIDAHDHTTGKGVQVPSAGLKINADVSFSFSGTHYALTDALAVDFTPTTTTSVAGYSSALFTNSADNNLYFRNSSGVNVQITSGSTLNISVVGGIGGDYASVGALLSFDDATKRYLHQSEGSPRPWSGIATADIDLYEKAASITNKVTLKSPNALGASYTVTMPAAVPGGTQLLTMTSGGVLQNDGVLGSNQNIKLQGTGYLQSGNFTSSGPFTNAGWNINTGSLPGYTTTTSAGVVVQASNTLYYPLNVVHDDANRVINVKVSGRSNGTNDAALSLVSANNGLDGFQGLYAPIAGATATITHGAGSITVTLTPSSPFTPGNGTNVWLKIVNPAGGTCDLYSWSVTQDRP